MERCSVGAMKDGKAKGLEFHGDSDGRYSIRVYSISPDWNETATFDDIPKEQLTSFCNAVLEALEEE